MTTATKKKAAQLKAKADKTATVTKPTVKSKNVKEQPVKAPVAKPVKAGKRSFPRGVRVKLRIGNRDVLVNAKEALIFSAMQLGTPKGQELTPKAKTPTAAAFSKVDILRALVAEFADVPGTNNGTHISPDCSGGYNKALDLLQSNGCVMRVGAQGTELGHLRYEGQVGIANYLTPEGRAVVIPVEARLK